MESRGVDVGRLVAGRYRVTRSIGAGGMGTVFQADDLEQGRPVALKVLLQQDAHTAARFLREAAALKSVAHPAIVGYVDHGVAEEGSIFLAMEWLEGEDLSSTLRRGPLSATATLALAKRVASGLAALHAAGLVHRDLKPANIVLEGGEASRARIVDLGIARSTLATRTLTRTGALVGTVGTWRPSRWKGGATSMRAPTYTRSGVCSSSASRAVACTRVIT